MSFAPENTPLAKPETLLRVPVGMVSPLWGFYAGAAVSGAAWWWMTRWARPENLEALFGKTAESTVLETPAAETVEAIVEALVEAAPEPEAAIEPVTETFEALVQAEAAAEAVIEPPALSEPVGGEAAPVAPALAAEAPEADTAPKPRVKKPASKAD